MKVLTPSLNLHGFLARLPSARARVLMLDYDGTLVLILEFVVPLALQFALREAGEEAV